MHWPTDYINSLIIFNPKENYGKEDDVHVERILELYEDSILREKFAVFKAKFMGDFLREIETFAKPKIAAYIKNIALSIASWTIDLDPEKPVIFKIKIIQINSSCITCNWLPT